MTRFPASYFPSLRSDNDTTACEPLLSAICNYCKIDPTDEEAGVIQVDTDEGIEAQNFGPSPSGEDTETDYETAGEYYYVSNSFDGYGYLIHVCPNGSLSSCWRR